MLEKSVKLSPWSRVVALVLIAFNLGSQTADVLAYLRPLQWGATATPGEQYLLLNDVDGVSSTWDCAQSIEIAVNLQKIPEQYRADTVHDLLAVIKTISDRSEFQFQFVGETSAVPTKAWGHSWRSWIPAAPVVISFGDTSDTDLFLPNALAVGGYFRGEDEIGQLRPTAGFVYVQAGQFLKLKKGGGSMSRRSLLSHELLHVLGLGHVHPTHRDSVMTPWLSASSGKIGPGDVEGLRRLAEIGCPSKAP